MKYKLTRKQVLVELFNERKLSRNNFDRLRGLLLLKKPIDSKKCEDCNYYCQVGCPTDCTNHNCFKTKNE